MEPQAETTQPTPIKPPQAAKGEKKEVNTKWTVFELETIHQIIGSRGSGAGIKDIRLISSVAKKIKQAIPVRPEPPPKAKTDSPEDKKAYMEAIEKWQKELEARVDSEVVLMFGPVDMAIIIQKLRAFPSYSTDEDVRERLVVLFDKLNIE